jgi:heme/copper-type cytochrome/quinol oxidase subunit 1
MRREVRAFAESFFATDEGKPDAEHLDWALDELGQMLAHAGVRARFLFRMSVFTMTYLVPLVLMGMPRRFSQLADPDRLEALHRAERSPAGLAVFLVRAMISFTYYEHPRGAASIGWDQKCMIAPKDVAA